MHSSQIAMRTRIWSPRLGDGWVPQGVAVGGGFLWVAAYQSTDPKRSRGPCRVFQIDPTDGGKHGEIGAAPSVTSDEPDHAGPGYPVGGGTVAEEDDAPPVADPGPDA